MKPALGFLAALGVALVVGFGLGAAAPWTFGAPDAVHLTEAWSYEPAARPWLHGLVWAVSFGLAVGAVAAGLAIARGLFQLGVLLHVVGIGLLGSGLLGAGLALFGGPAGLDGDQRGGMAIVAVTLGGMGAMMVAALVRDAVRGRRGR